MEGQEDLNRNFPAMNKPSPFQMLLAGGCLTLFAGATCQAVDATTPLPPGKMYNVGGHKMHLYATGEGGTGPPVVLEAGSGAFSVDWCLVQQQVAKFAPVCSYDRAGHAWSELGPRPRTMKQAASDLHRLLSEAGIRGPYIMVGHSLGGFIVRVFAREFPNDVAGMVLVDSSVENNQSFINGKLVGPWNEAKPRQIPSPRDHILDEERALSNPELEGYKKFRDWMGEPKIEEPYDRLPEQVQNLRLWAMSLPQSNVTDYNPYAEEESLLLFSDRIRSEHPLRNIPLAVLSRKSDDKTHIEREQELRNLSGNGVFVVSDFPIHEIQLAQPDLVVDAVRAVIEAVKSGGQVNLPRSEQRR
jgi:pimeloyl-ACP methyl ester carboxylesterase